MPFRSNSPLDEIVAEFDRTTPIDAAAVRRWLETDDLKAMGALAALFSEPRFDSRIKPPLSPEEYYPFFRDYYFRAIVENPSGEWAHSASEAGYEFAHWFREIWSDPDSRSVIPDLKEALTRTFLAATPEVRERMLLSALELMFEDQEIIDYFADWKDDPILLEAYRDLKQLAEAQRARRLRKDWK